MNQLEYEKSSLNDQEPRTSTSADTNMVAESDKMLKEIQKLKEELELANYQIAS